MRYLETHPRKGGSCRGILPGERAKQIVALLQAGTPQEDLARVSGEPQSYINRVLDMPASFFRIREVA